LTRSGVPAVPDDAIRQFQLDTVKALSIKVVVNAARRALSPGAAVHNYAASPSGQVIERAKPSRYGCADASAVSRTDFSADTPDGTVTA